jgi:hypothetical protein
MLKQVLKNRNSDKQQSDRRPRTNSQSVPPLAVDQAIQHAQRMATSSQSERSSVNDSDMSRTPSSHSGRHSPLARTGSRPSTPHLDVVLDYSGEWCEQQLYVEYSDGLLCKNARPFTRVTHCFVCDVGVDPESDRRLLPSVEPTGTKSHQGAHVTVYRQVFRCHQCAQQPSSQVVRISRDTHQLYFIAPERHDSTTV